ncbi:class I SAM-dependent methyltransferase [Parasphingorhabdus sp.]|uniref:class I SAM-dependent methyltransferase n=1 Tax=Parasphingorhabdus sp. TaxID=2709688 RepID=UPI003BAF810A
MRPLYDRIGIGYAGLRRPDPRIAKAIHDALGSAQSVLNVGAGTGSYEPADRHVTALEPSAEMIRQRPPESAKAHQGIAENLPFADDQFDAVMAVLTVHHWTDLDAGLREMRRVAKDRVVILTFDPASDYFWLADYIPEIITIDQPIMPKISAYEKILGKLAIENILIPCDCTDGFLGAYWRRPSAYLDSAIRSAISTFAKLDNAADGLARLEQDLASGDWDKQYGHLMELETLDIGYRLIVADHLDRE